MSPEEIREHATKLILEVARDVERSSVREYLNDEGEPYTGDDVTAIQDAIAKAEVSVAFPDAHP